MKTLIIAEAGVNHNGDLALARKLIEVAAAAGADRVKFQTFSADALVTTMPPKRIIRFKVRMPMNPSMICWAVEPTGDMHDELIAHCNAQGIEFFSSGFDAHSVDILATRTAKLQDPFRGDHESAVSSPRRRVRQQVIFSSGMASLGEIEAAS